MGAWPEMCLYAYNKDTENRQLVLEAYLQNLKKSAKYTGKHPCQSFIFN